MRMPALGLALGSIVACGGPPAEVTTDLSTTEPAPTSGSPTSNPDDTGPTSETLTSADTGEEVCPPMPPEDGSYDQCPGLCGGGGQCFNDPGEYAVCTRGCFMDCNCWPAPDGDAPVRCSSALLENTSVCVLDCSGGESCPRGMFCVSDLGICAHPYPGTEPETGSSSSDGETTDMGTSSSSDGGSSSSGESSSDGGSSSSGESSSDGGSSGSSSESGSTTAAT